MSGLTRPRGTLPARVYWFRRFLVLGTALALVFAVARLIGGGGAEEPPPAAVPAAGSPSSTGPTQRPLVGPVPVTPKAGQGKPKGNGTGKPKGNGTGKPKGQQGQAGQGQQGQQQTSTSTPLAQPSGPCAVNEISVTADLRRAIAGRDITIPLELTGTQAACTFRVGPRTLLVKIVSGDDRIWSTQDCRRAVKVRNVVVRSAQPTRISITWKGRRSDDGCPSGTAWAKPGWYHAITSAIGSEPSDTQFRLVAPPRPVVTQTADPKPQG